MTVSLRSDHVARQSCTKNEQLPQCDVRHTHRSFASRKKKAPGVTVVYATNACGRPDKGTGKLRTAVRKSATNTLNYFSTYPVLEGQTRGVLRSIRGRSEEHTSELQ